MIRAILKADTRGGLPDFIQAEDKETTRFEKGKIYLLPDDYDFSNGWFESLEKELQHVKRNRIIK